MSPGSNISTVRLAGSIARDYSRNTPPCRIGVFILGEYGWASIIRGLVKRNDLVWVAIEGFDLKALFFFNFHPTAK